MMPFEVRDLMIDVFPASGGVPLYLCALASAAAPAAPECALATAGVADDEEGACEPPSCEGSAPADDQSEEDPAGGSGLATLQRELRATLAAEAGAAG
jgi:hypothetical protein